MTPILLTLLLACSDKADPVDTGAETSTTTDTSTGVTDTSGAETGTPGGDDTGDTDAGTADSGDDTSNTDDTGGTGGTGGADDTDDTDDTTGAASEAVFEALITATDPVMGEQSCFRPGAGCVTLSADESCVNDATLSGEVVDFERGDAVADARVSVFLDDIWDSTPDETLTSDRDGRIGGVELPTCTPITWEVTTDPHLAETVATVSGHLSLTPDGVSDAAIPSFSADTAAIIPSLLGVTVEEGAGMVSGVLRDCAGDALVGAQVIIDVGGGYPEGQSSHYFVNDFPNRDQEATSADGLWLLLNLPPGPAQVEAWGVVEGLDEPILLAYTDAEVISDGVTLVDLQMGYCGPYIPDACLEPCE